MYRKTILHGPRAAAVIARTGHSCKRRQGSIHVQSEPRNWCWTSGSGPLGIYRCLPIGRMEERRHHYGLLIVVAPQRGQDALRALALTSPVPHLRFR